MKKIKFLMFLVCFAAMFSCSEDEGSDLLTEQEVVLEENRGLNVKRPSNFCDDNVWSNAGFHHSNVWLRGSTAIGWTYDFTGNCGLICPPLLVDYTIEYQGFYYDLAGNKVWDPNQIFSFNFIHSTIDTDIVFTMYAREIGNHHLDGRFRIKLNCESTWSDWIEHTGVFI